MLILTRKPEQSIIIDSDIVVTVLAIDGDRVKIGIKAPMQVSVLREEIQRQVGGENRRAATASLFDVQASLRSLKRPING